MRAKSFHGAPHCERPIQEGKNAGTGEQIAVLTGADNRETLEKAQPTRIIETLKDLF